MAELNEPLVSVCVPLYNAERYIEQTIKSVLSQTYLNFEIIICDDKSQDRSFEICRGISDPRIILIQNNVNQGVAFTRKTIYAIARGEYIANLDADDLMYPDRLVYQVGILRSNSELHFIAAGVDEIDENNYKLTTNSSCIKPKEVQALLFCRNLIANSTILFRSEILKRVEYPNLRVAQDFLFNVLVAEHFNIEIFPEVVGAYRRHASSLTNNRSKEIVNDELVVLTHQIQGIYNENSDRNVLLALNDYLKFKRPIFGVELQKLVKLMDNIIEVIAKTDPERARILSNELTNLEENNKNVSSDWLIREPGVFSISLLRRYYSISRWPEIYGNSLYWHAKFWLKCLMNYKSAAYR